MAIDESITINLPPSLYDRGKGKRAGKRAKVSIEITSQPIVAIMDMAKVENAAAEALANEIRRRIKAVTKPVSQGTLARRSRYAREFAAGEKTAVRRFAGTSRAKLPVTPPLEGAVKWLNHSGRLALGVVATFNPRAGSQGGWTVNVAANRLNAQEFGPARFEKFAAEFDALVMQRGGHPTNTRAYQQAVDDALPMVISHLQAQNAATRSKLRGIYGNIVGDVLRAAAF